MEITNRTVEVEFQNEHTGKNEAFLADVQRVGDELTFRFRPNLGAGSKEYPPRPGELVGMCINVRDVVG